MPLHVLCVLGEKLCDRCGEKLFLSDKAVKTTQRKSGSIHDDLFQSLQEPIHFLRGVVVCQADAQEAAALLHVKPFCEVEGVVISIPGKEAALAKLRRQLKRSIALNADGKSGATMGEARCVGNAIELQLRNLPQSLRKPLCQAALMLLDCSIPIPERGAPA